MDGSARSIAAAPIISSWCVVPKSVATSRAGSISDSDGTSPATV